MTEQDVYIDCAAAHQKANALRGEANDVRSIAQGIQGQLGSLASCWKGGSSALFVQSGTSRITKLHQAANRLDELANAIDQTANAYQKRQIEAIRAAKNSS